MNTSENISYDKAMERIEEIVSNLEQAQAMSLDEYKKQAKEAKDLLQFCQSEIEGMKKQLEE